LYGLKQAGRCWYELLRGVLQALGFVQSDCDPCLFTHRDGSHVTFLLVYVDDLLAASTEPEFLKKVEASLSTEFELQDAGEPELLLGMHILRAKVTGMIKLHQRRYVTDVVKRFGMENANPVSTPM